MINDKILNRNLIATTKILKLMLYFLDFFTEKSKLGSGDQVIYKKQTDKIEIIEETWMQK